MSKIDELLKDLQQNTINFTIDLLSDPKKSIIFRPIKTKDQKIMSIEKAENDDVPNFEIKNFESILKLVDTLLIKSPTPLGQISIPDFIWLLINIRAKSIGETIDLVAYCHKCKSKMDFSIDVFKDIIKTSPKSDINTKIKLTNKITIELGMIDVADLNNIMRVPNDNRNLVTMASLIKSVDFEGEVIDISLGEKVEIVEELSKEKIELINKYADESAFGVKLEKSYICPSCSHEGKYIFDSYEIISFF